MQILELTELFELSFCPFFKIIYKLSGEDWIRQLNRKECVVTEMNYWIDKGNMGMSNTPATVKLSYTSRSILYGHCLKHIHCRLNDVWNLRWFAVVKNDLCFFHFLFSDMWFSFIQPKKKRFHLIGEWQNSN